MNNNLELSLFGINNGLKRSYVNVVLEIQKNQTRNRYQICSIASGFTTGGISGSGAFIGFVHDYNQIALAEVYGGRLFVDILGMTMGWLVIGVILGFATAGLVHFIGVLKVRRIEREIFNMKSRYGEDGLIEGKDLVELIKMADKESLQDLVAQMNFQQLAVTKKTLGNKKFKKLIESSQKEPHRQWQLLLSLPFMEMDAQTIESLKRDLRQFSPYAWTLREEINKIDSVKNKILEADLKSYPFALFHELPDSPEELEIEFIGNGTIKTNRSLIFKNSGYLRTLSDENFKHTEELSEENPASLELLVRMFNQEEVTLDKKTVLALFPLANKLSAQKVLYVLSTYVIAHPELFSYEEMCDFVNQCPQLDLLKAYLEQSLMARELSKENWQKYYRYAQQAGINDLNDKCEKYCKEQLEKALANANEQELKIWLKNGFNFLTATDIKNKISVGNFRTVYEFAKEGSIEDLLAACEQFWEQHSTDVKNAIPWPLNTIPSRLKELLYPDPKFVPGAW
jgi:hypothetical protein